MPPYAETVCANSALIECRLKQPLLWAAEPVEISAIVCIRLRAVAWGVTLSAFLWGLVILAGRALWLVWR